MIHDFYVTKWTNSLPRNQLQSSVKAQSEFRQSIEKSTHFSAEEKACLQVDSEEAFKHIWTDALTTKKHFDERRGLGGPESKLAAFASCTQEIFNSMSPMVDLLKDTGVPYVGIALGTLSFFFMVRPVIKVGCICAFPTDNSCRL